MAYITDETGESVARQVSAWFKDNALRLPTCDVCQARSWVATRVTQLTMSDEEQSFDPEPTRFPVVGLICRTCGQVKWFSWRLVSRQTTSDKL